MSKPREKGHYLLVASTSESIDGKKIPAEEMARRRFEVGLWGLNANTPHKSEIKAGDDLIVYLAGIRGQAFVAIATAGNVYFNAVNYSADGDALSSPPAAVLELTDIRHFKRNVNIHEVKDRLGFIPKGTIKWGCVLQRGLKRLSQEDASLILQEGGL
ncbi:hypothetical protein [Nitrincola sp. MINF-07-Sa-05]|uniref:hypothetical protein n=1 Tax=Nitrincola salilacus TaxID=3400273 RepID=UPI00391828F8